MYVAKQLKSQSLVSLLALASVLAAANAGLAQTPTRTAAPPDALIKNWEQTWTLQDDGGIVYHTRQEVRLNSDRAYDEFADPRITYDRNQQEIEVVMARVQRPDGSHLDLPEYGNVAAAPNDLAGWPSFGDVVQRVLVLSGIEPGCTTQVEYVVRSAPGMQPYLEADQRIDAKYPVGQHTVEVVVPASAKLSPIVTGIDNDGYDYSFQQNSDGSKVHRWVFTELPARPEEPQALPWQAGGVRLAFTTAPDAKAWLTSKLDRLYLAADDSELIRNLAGEWTADAERPAERIAALQQHLSRTFNFLDIPAAFTPPNPRRATRVLNASYGTEAEAAALLQSLAQAAQVALRPALLVSDDVWLADAPQEAMIAAVVLLRDGDDGIEVWHPQHGRLRHNARWAGYRVLGMKLGEFEEYVFPAWTDAKNSRLQITGEVEFTPDGAYTGEIELDLHGLFVDPGALQEASGQRRAIRDTLARVLPDVEVRDFAVTRKADGRFAAEVAVASRAPLPQLFGRYKFMWDADSPALAEVSLPLTHSDRETPARLTGAFSETIDLKIRWPAAWHAEALPTREIKARGDWGDAVQLAVPLENGVHWQRNVRVLWRDLPARWIVELREPLNKLRTATARTLLLEP